MYRGWLYILKVPAAAGSTALHSMLCLVQEEHQACSCWWHQAVTCDTLIIEQRIICGEPGVGGLAHHRLRQQHSRGSLGIEWVPC
jgi:hypothetical protein